MSAVVPDPAATPPQTARVANIANALTLLRLLLVPVFGWALLQEDGTSTGWRVTAFVVFAVASITDRLDGDLRRARRHGCLRLPQVVSGQWTRPRLRSCTVRSCGDVDAAMASASVTVPDCTSCTRCWSKVCMP